MSDVDLGLRKSIFVVVVIVGCFAVLWPKVLHPMMVGPTADNHRMKPNNMDKGCCDVISDIDINTIKIINELCNSIIQQSDIKSVRGQDIQYCRTEILAKCGIDISAVLQEQIWLGYPFKRIVDELRSFNGSSCLKYNFGISPWLLGVPHKVSINLTPFNIKQERSPHMKPEMMHPALRERGSAIPQSYPSPSKAPPNVKYVEGRPGPIPGMRPPMGGGHMAQAQKNVNSMGIVMPLYTIGIVIFFSYTLMKVVFRKRPEGPGSPLYPPVDPSPAFRKEVFESQKSKVANGTTSSKLVVNAMTALLDEVDLELEAQGRSSEKEHQTVMGNGSVKPSHDQPSVKILGMETTASCEGGQKWSRPDSPVIPNLHPPPPEPVEPPQEIYLEGALPAQSQLLVADAVTEPELVANEDPAVVLASKMTLSVISVDVPEENGGFLQQNGDVYTTENDEESKYTTASCATAAEPDLSEDEHTDDEMIDEINKLPEYVVNNGIQEIDMDIHTDDEEEIEIDVEEEEIEEEEEVDQEEEEVDQGEEEELEVEEEEIVEWVDEPDPMTREFEKNILTEINDNTKTTENNAITLHTHVSSAENSLNPSENHDEMLNNENTFRNENDVTSGNIAAGNNVDVNENNQKSPYLQSNDPSVNAVLEHIATLSNIVDDIVNSEVNPIEEHEPPKLFDI